MQLLRRAWIRLTSLGTIALVVLGLSLGMADSAAAISSSGSPASKGAAQLDGILQESRQVLEEAPRGFEPVKDKSKRGENGVQGQADLDKQNLPRNSKDAVSAREQAENLLEDAEDSVE